MFAAKIPGTVHQFDGIKRAAAFPRRYCSVRGFAMKKILNGNEAAPLAISGAIGSGKFAVDVRPEDKVDVLKVPGANIKRLGRNEFFRNTRKNYQRAGEVIFLHLLFENEGSGYVHGHARVVAFAVTRSAFD